MTQTPRIVYRPRFDATPQAEVSALAACYRIVLSANGRGSLPDKSGPDDAQRAALRELGDLELVDEGHAVLIARLGGARRGEA